jgi:predicted PurR-regulated permease PerM
MLIVLGAIPLIIIPPLAAQSAGLNLDLQRFLTEAETQIASLLGYRYQVAGWTIDVTAAIDQAIVSIQGLIEPVVGQTLGFAFGVITSLVWVVFILVVSFYLTKDSPALLQWLEDIAPPAYKDDFIRLRREINLIWSAFFRGQLVLATVVAIMISAVGFIIGLPFALAMGVLAGLLEFLPSIGHGIWLTIASILAFFAGSTWMHVPNWVFMLIVIGLHLFFQQFDINYLIPRIIGRRVHLPPLVVILGIVSGALLAGVLGVLLAAPTIASARVIGRYIYANLFDQDPFPDSVAPPLPPPNPRWWRKTSDEGTDELASES